MGTPPIPHLTLFQTSFWSYAFLKRCVLSWLLNEFIESEFRMFGGRDLRGLGQQWQTLCLLGTPMQGRYVDWAVSSYKHPDIVFSLTMHGNRVQMYFCMNS
jgi:hypothetical protein